jgi:transposase
MPDVTVIAVDDQPGGPIRVHVEQRVGRPACAGCGAVAWVKDRPVVELVDLGCFGRPARLMWHKHRWCCPAPACPVGSWTSQDSRIAAARLAMTDRAGRWATLQVGRHGRTVNEVARELGCDWHTVNDAVIAYGAPLVEDPARIGQVTAVGLDEVLFARQGRWRTHVWSTTIADVDGGQLLDVIPGHSAAEACRWFGAPAVRLVRADRLGGARPVRPVAVDLRHDAAPASQVADPFHLVKLANQRLDEVRRRVQNETLGHRGRKHDPLYRSRRLLTRGDERLDDRGRTKLLGLLDAGDPHGEVRTAWHAKEVVRSIYDQHDPDLALEFVARLGADLQDDSCPPEVRRLGRTIVRWRHQIAAWHHAQVSNGPTEALNKRVKRVKRVAFGFRRFAHYRIRALLYAASPTGTYSRRSHPAEVR